MDDFAAAAFLGLTGNPPLDWQRRLFHEHFASGDFPSLIDLPTGLGKTMVMALWLIARALQGRRIPTRLVYVVDRRTVVDQATDLAEKLVENWGKSRLPGDPPVISTLRGQLADNREWSRDPTRPAIVVGTVDLIGSALLFSGYRSSFKRRPLEAGLLGQDSLLVLDEAHLSKPFEKLLQSIETFNKHGDDSSFPVKPMRVIRMSATSAADSAAPAFRLKGDFESRTGDFADDVIRDRYAATKTLSVVESEKPVDTIAETAHSHATKHPGSRIAVFVQTPKQVTDVRKALVKEDKEYSTRIAQLTGTMRGLERDELVDTTKPLGDGDWERRAMQRFLKPDNDPLQGVCFLISTSAGEVGFDLNADHLVGDEAPLDSWIQRLGRVNRRGQGNATVILVKGSEAAEKTDFDKACMATSRLLYDGMDVSPKALATFKDSLPVDSILAACSPTPQTVEINDILLDAWSMTSIVERMPGRPEVGPWLRGIDDEQAQTTVAWRAELEVLKGDPLAEHALQIIFAKHPIRPHESLTVGTGYLLEFLKRIQKLKDRPADLMLTRVAVRFARGPVVCLTLQNLVNNPGILYADSSLILPAAFGGLDAAGMLDADSIATVRDPNGPEPRSLDVADRPNYEPQGTAGSRLRILIRRSEDGEWSASPLPGGMPIPQGVALQDGYKKSSALFNDLRQANFRVRLRQPLPSDEDGDNDPSILFLAPAPESRGRPEIQLLVEHVAAVEAQADRIANELQLPSNDPLRAALCFAAKWHDEGKKARVWQYFANSPDSDGVPLGKSALPRDPKVLRGYRHELGSLLRIERPERCETGPCDPPELRDLAWHLIATHHGLARPHFWPTIYDDFSDGERDAANAAVIRRFADLQRQHGWWRLAWLENLLRCADALASASQIAEDDPTGAEGDAV